VALAATAIAPGKFVRHLLLAEGVAAMAALNERRPGAR